MKTFKLLVVPFFSLFFLFCSTFSYIYASQEVAKNPLSSDFKLGKEERTLFTSQQVEKAFLLSDNQISTYNDVNSAIEIETDVVYQAAIPSDNSVWVKVKVTGGKKLTAVSQFAERATYQTNIYYLSDSSTLTRVTSSKNIFENNDTVSVLSKTGWYYIQFALVSGNRTLNFTIVESSGQSNKEPNDSIYQAKEYSDFLSLSDNFDNYYDEDWSLLKVSESGNYYISLASNNNLLLPVTLYIINLNTGEMSYLVDDTPLLGKSINLSSNVSYAVGVLSASNIAVGESYNLEIKKNTSTPIGYLEVHYVEDEPNIGNHSDVNGGSIGFWVKGQQAKITGYYKSDNYTRQISAKIHGKTFTTKGIGTINERGYVTIYISLPTSLGLDGSFNGTYYTHHYDCDPIEFYDDKGRQISSNLTQLKIVRD